MSAEDEPATEKETVIGEIVGAVIDHKQIDANSATETEPADGVNFLDSPATNKDLADALSLTPDAINLFAGLTADDLPFFNRGFRAFGNDRWIDDCPFLADEHKSALWLKGFSQGVMTEGWMSAKYGKPIESCPYIERVEQSPEHRESAGEFDVAATWRKGWQAFHGVADVNTTNDGVPATAIVEPTDQDAVILKLADGTEAVEYPGLEKLAENQTPTPAPSLNSHVRAPFNSAIGALWLQEIQEQNKIVQRAEAEFEAAKLFARGKKTAHEEAVSKLTKLISDQEEMQTAWNRPLPLFDATQIFKPGESASATTDSPQADSVAAATEQPKPVDSAKTGPLTDEQVENAWRYASILELNLPKKLAEKLREDAHVSNIGELEDLRATFKGLGGIKGIGPGKITIIEDAVVAWLSIQRDAKALAAAGLKSPVQITDQHGNPVTIEELADSMADVSPGENGEPATVGEPVGATATATAVGDSAAVDFDDI